MHIDKTTLSDLSIFNLQDQSTLFYQIDFTTTAEGKSELIHILHHPLHKIEDIIDVQRILAQIGEHEARWPTEISNGTLLVIEKFFNDNPDMIPEDITPIQAAFYKWIHPRDFALILFSMKQLFQLIKGYQKIHEFFSQPTLPKPLHNLLSETKNILADIPLQALLRNEHFEELSTREILYYGRFFHVERVQEIKILIKRYGKLDAWHAMACANKALDLKPPFFTAESTEIEAKSLKHLLIQHAVRHDISMNKERNFIFLTGANMAGKSTLIKALGLAVYMAHLGMGVPAHEMRLSIFEGMISNINITDNISMGESYFFNEVKRVKETIGKINDGKNWLVLIDELFKGTNIQDAMKCSTAVIRGLINIKQCLFMLSTHLYEIGEELKNLPTINFKYFETILKDGELHFSYQLKNGISQDRMGYFILKKEGVISLLEALGNQHI